MAKWTLADGTRLLSGGRVEGASPVAEELRRRIALGDRVYILEPPDGRVDLDTSSDYHLHHWIEAAAGELRVWPVVTSYVLDVADLSPEDRAMVAEFATFERADPDAEICDG